MTQNLCTENANSLSLFEQIEQKTATQAAAAQEDSNNKHAFYTSSEQDKLKQAPEEVKKREGEKLSANQLLFLKLAKSIVTRNYKKYIDDLRLYILLSAASTDRRVMSKKRDFASTEVQICFEGLTIQRGKEKYNDCFNLNNKVIQNINFIVSELNRNTALKVHLFIEQDNGKTMPDTFLYTHKVNNYYLNCTVFWDLMSAKDIYILNETLGTNIAVSERNLKLQAELDKDKQESNNYTQEQDDYDQASQFLDEHPVQDPGQDDGKADYLKKLTPSQLEYLKKAKGTNK